MPDQSQIPELRDTMARACRILAMEGVVDGVLGHVSVRIGEDRMLICGRGPGEHGLLFTTIDDIRLVGFDGAGDDPADVTRWRMSCPSTGRPSASARR